MWEGVHSLGETRMKIWKLFIFTTCALFVFTCIAAGESAADTPMAGEKLTTKDLIARHLNAIGPESARAAAKSRAVQGTVQMDIVVGSNNHADGNALMVSDGRKLIISMAFQQGGSEKFIYDGQKAQIGYIAANQRSSIGDFFYTNDSLLRDGLLGGATMTSWALLDVDARKADVRYEGLKVVDGKQLHDLSYYPKKSDADLHVHLYFDPQTFRHVKTVYTFKVSASMRHGTNSGKRMSGSMSHGDETRIRVEENFSDFRELDGLTLPGHWSLRYTSEGGYAEGCVFDVAVVKMANNVVTE